MKTVEEILDFLEERLDKCKEHYEYYLKQGDCFDYVKKYEDRIATYTLIIAWIESEE